MLEKIKLNLKTENRKERIDFIGSQLNFVIKNDLETIISFLHLRQI